jgi:hypothetical protein
MLRALRTSSVNDSTFSAAGNPSIVRRGKLSRPPTAMSSISSSSGTTSYVSSRPLNYGRVVHGAAPRARDHCAMRAVVPEKQAQPARPGREESNRCPVRATCTATSAVSRSRISPTMTMFGLCRRNKRKARAKVSPIEGLTCTC